MNTKNIRIEYNKKITNQISYILPSNIYKKKKENVVQNNTYIKNKLVNKTENNINIKKNKQLSLNLNNLSNKKNLFPAKNTFLITNKVNTNLDFIILEQYWNLLYKKQTKRKLLNFKLYSICINSIVISYANIASMYEYNYKNTRNISLKYSSLFTKNKYIQINDIFNIKNTYLYVNSILKLFTVFNIQIQVLSTFKFISNKEKIKE